MMPPKEKIEEIIKELKLILRLTNWEIDFDYCDQCHMNEISKAEDSVACNSYDIRLNYSHIYMSTDTKRPNEWYVTLVHELFHLVTNDYMYHAVSMLDYVEGGIPHTKEGNILNTYYEQLVENLARIFCSIYPATNFIKEEVQ